VLLCAKQEKVNSELGREIVTFDEPKVYFLSPDCCRAHLHTRGGPSLYVTSFALCLSKINHYRKVIGILTPQKPS
jgi:hypothetical protein